MKIFSKGPFAAIFWGGLIAGILDITQAFIPGSTQLLYSPGTGDGEPKGFD
jgi:hypothetical protein